ncbi:MAG: hypothetical protein SGI73_19625 [Chloroflexota bacterium]|nr:hypothetical protein [Chloroflexota bacterium]
MQKNRARWAALCGWLGIGIALVALVFSGAAPPAALYAQAFPTNTPAPTPNRPDAPADRYALRLWTEDALVATLIAQIRALRPNDEQAARAVALLQREWAHRYPSAVIAAADRDALLDAARAAPPGSVNLREWARSYAQDALNAARPVYDATARVESDGWRLELTAANFDGRGSLDALVRVVDAGVFDAYFIAVIDDDGAYTLLPGALPAAPFAGAVVEAQLSDFTGDGIDDLALGVGTTNASRRLIVVNARGGRVVDLTAPGQTMQFTQLVAMQPLTLLEQRLAAARWGCVSEQFTYWRYARNLFSLIESSADTPQNTLACQLDALEPLYAPPPAEAFARIASVLSTGAVSTDDLAGKRALLAQVMLTALNGDVTEAQRLARGIDAAGDAYLARQTAQFLRLAERGESPLTICGALAAMERTGGEPTVERPGVGICAPDDALFRALTDAPPTRDAPLRDQLVARGLSPVSESLVRAVGRLDRALVGVELGGAIHWLTFALPTGSAVYTVERASAPDDYPTLTPIEAAPAIPAAVYALLLRGEGTPAYGALGAGDLRLVLTQLENAPGALTTPEGQFVRAWINDLLNQRALAASQYLTLWSASPATVWGQMAAAHVERR